MITWASGQNKEGEDAPGNPSVIGGRSSLQDQDGLSGETLYLPARSRFGEGRAAPSIDEQKGGTSKKNSMANGQ